MKTYCGSGSITNVLLGERVQRADTLGTVDLSNSFEKSLWLYWRLHHVIEPALSRGKILQGQPYRENLIYGRKRRWVRLRTPRNWCVLLGAVVVIVNGVKLDPALNRKLSKSYRKSSYSIFVSNKVSGKELGEMLLLVAISSEKTLQIARDRVGRCCSILVLPQARELIFEVKENKEGENLAESSETDSGNFSEED